VNNSPEKAETVSYIKFKKPANYGKISLKLLHNKGDYYIFTGLKKQLELSNIPIYARAFSPYIPLLLLQKFFSDISISRRDGIPFCR